MGQPAEEGENPVPAGGLYERLETLEKRLVQHDDLIGRPAAVYPDYTKNTPDTGLYRMSVATEARLQVLYRAPSYGRDHMYTAEPLACFTFAVLEERVWPGGNLYNAALSPLVHNNWPTADVLNWPIAVTLWQATSDTPQGWVYLREGLEIDTQHTLVVGTSSTAITGNEALRAYEQLLLALQETTTPPGDGTMLIVAWAKQVPVIGDGYIPSNSHLACLRTRHKRLAELADDTIQDTTENNGENVRARIRLKWETRA
ncbi:MAG: hypothetical protein LBJ69_01520 [Holosporales bacterium]|jgi:hypothetical protein|nr:hypothetical protein [Holosporales bacterium]